MKDMKNYDIYYSKNPEDALICVLKGELPKLTISDLKNTHIYLKRIKAISLEDVFMQMQEENWSPNGEARGIIKSKGLKHTSMSVGDVVREIETDTVYRCAAFGWEKIFE